MIINIPDNISAKIGLNEQDVLLEIAIALFKEEKITLGQASKIASLHQSQFQKILAKRRIPIHYGIEELEQDLETLKRIEVFKNN